MRELFLECATGLGGDMFLAAVADLGLDLGPLEGIFRNGGVDCRIASRRERKLGLMGSVLDLSFAAEQPHRRLEDLLGVVDALEISDEVRRRTRRALQRLAEVESLVHGIPMEEVHFHEIGGLDTLIDVTGAFWALERLEISRVVSAPLPWFSGTVDTEHGRLPLPAPATVELLRSKPVRPTTMTRELVTPTGALIIDQLAQTFSSGPEGTVDKVGTGWGNMDLGEVPNGLRVFLLSGRSAEETVWVLETTIDHLTGEELGGAIEAIMGSGALDAIFLPGVMKKNRPGGLLQVLCGTEALDEVEGTIFAHTLSLGIRRTLTARRTLPRRGTVWNTRLGSIESKEFDLQGSRYLRPEFESLRRLARTLNLSPAQIRLLLRERIRGEDPPE
jgi:pyridinium-3,5-bisthiocarboxylic acid mononucleotide nickel chelatase